MLRHCIGKWPAEVCAPASLLAHTHLFPLLFFPVARRGRHGKQACLLSFVRQRIKSLCGDKNMAEKNAILVACDAGGMKKPVLIEIACARIRDKCPSVVRHRCHLKK
jgi:hypothetical protein